MRDDRLRSVEFYCNFTVYLYFSHISQITLHKDFERQNEQISCADCMLYEKCHTKRKFHTHVTYIYNFVTKLLAYRVRICIENVTDQNSIIICRVCIENLQWINRMTKIRLWNSRSYFYSLDEFMFENIREIVPTAYKN